MSNFIFHVDRKCTIWNRETYRVHADTESQAIQRMKQIFEEIDEDNPEFEMNEQLFDTINYMTPEENNNQETSVCMFKSKELFSNKSV